MFAASSSCSAIAAWPQPSAAGLRRLPTGPVSRPPLKVADVFRRYGDAFRAGRSLTALPPDVTSATEFSRTAALAGQIEQ